MVEQMPSYEELAVSAEKRYTRAMRGSLITGVILAFLALANGFLLVHLKPSGFILVFFATVEPLLIFASACLFINAVSFFEARRYEPRLWRQQEALVKLKQEALVKLKEEFSHYANGSNRCNIDLLRTLLEWHLFIKNRAPGLLAEFAAWEEEQTQPSAEDGDKDEGEKK